jgi:hypothetical protein
MVSMPSQPIRARMAPQTTGEKGIRAAALSSKLHHSNEDGALLFMISVMCSSETISHQQVTIYAYSKETNPRVAGLAVMRSTSTLMIDGFPEA